jgi:hypothetical protein
MYILKIRQVNWHEIFKFYEFQLVDSKTGAVIYKDSIDDDGQEIDEARRSIKNILKRKKYIN